MLNIYDSTFCIVVEDENEAHYVNVVLEPFLHWKTWLQLYRWLFYKALKLETPSTNATMEHSYVNYWKQCVGMHLM